MGSVKKIIFVFRERFWAERYPHAGFIYSENDLPAVWWTPSPDASPILTGWIGGPRAHTPSVAGEEDLLSASLATLAKLFAMPASKLRSYVLSWHLHDWDHDPFSKGAYSYIPCGSMQALYTLAEPVEDTLFFAGEHTDLTAQWGTVHAAMRSGLRTAQQVLKADQ
jgi:monoamine oxidase